MVAAIREAEESLHATARKEALSSTCPNSDGAPARNGTPAAQPLSLWLDHVAPALGIPERIPSQRNAAETSSASSGRACTTVWNMVAIPERACDLGGSGSGRCQDGRPDASVQGTSDDAQTDTPGRSSGAPVSNSGTRNDSVVLQNGVEAASVSPTRDFESSTPGIGKAVSSSGLVSFQPLDGALPSNHKLQPGDLVRMSDMRTPAADVSWRNSVEAEVASANALTGCLSVDLSKAGPVRALSERRWRFEVLENLVTFKRCMAAVRTVSDRAREAGGEENRGLLTELITSTFSSEVRDHGFESERETAAEQRNQSRNGSAEEIASAVVVRSDPIRDKELLSGCNDFQAAAVLAAATRRLTIVHGPPGTGKVRNGVF
jgi:hypothetical protein